MGERVSGKGKGALAPEIVLTGIWGWLSRRLGIQPWGQAFIVILIALAVLVGRIELRLASIDQSIKDLPLRTGDQVDAKLATFRADLIKELLEEGKKNAAAGNFETSSAAIRASTAALVLARKEKLPIDLRIFTVATQALRSISCRIRGGPSPLVNPVYRARIALADYRTSLTQLPRATINGYSITPLESMEAAQALGYRTVLRALPGVEHFDLSSKMGGLENADHLHNLALVDGVQVLGQHARWRHVLFVNVRIVYHGGPLSLSDVIFVNCLFDVGANSEGALLLEAAALGRQSITVG